MKRSRYMTNAEILTLVAYAKTCRPLVWAVIDTALQTGLRSCELAAMRVQHLDFRRRIIHVRRRKKRRKIVWDELPMSQSLAEHLGEFVKGREGGPLFIGQRGPLSAQGLQLLWKRTIRAAGLPHYSIHCARHTLAVHLLRSTGNLRLVQKQLGHSCVNTTASIYADVLMEDMQAAMDQVYGDEYSPRVIEEDVSVTAARVKGVEASSL